MSLQTRFKKILTPPKRLSEKEYGDKIIKEVAKGERKIDYHQGRQTVPYERRISQRLLDLEDKVNRRSLKRDKINNLGLNIGKTRSAKI